MPPKTVDKNCRRRPKSTPDSHATLINTCTYVYICVNKYITHAHKKYCVHSNLFLVQSTLLMVVAWEQCTHFPSKDMELRQPLWLRQLPGCHPCMGTCLVLNSGVPLTVYPKVQFLQMEASVLQPSSRGQIRKARRREGAAAKDYSVLFGRKVSGCLSEHGF